MLKFQLLNNQQKKAVFLKEENSLIIAGAGSGKTRVLTNRIIYLYKKKMISPLKLLVVTFTNKAAKEIKARIQDYLMGVAHNDMWIGTFHGICHRILRKYAPLIGLDSQFKILNQDEQIKIIKKVITHLNLDKESFSYKNIQHFINNQKDKGYRPFNLLTFKFNKHILNIYKNYESFLRYENLLDFGDLLLYVDELFQKNINLKEYYQKQFQYILIDEFQDTNAIQYRWLMKLKSKSNTIMAVGDDDQSIYGWRGAKIENIKNFINDFNPVRLIRLEQNYRSTNIILNAANSIILNNEKRIEKKLWSLKKDQGSKIIIYEGLNEREESNFISNKISYFHVKQNVKLSNIAILYRSNAQSRIIEESLLKKGLSYNIYGGFRFFDRSEIKDILAYLRLIVSREDNLAFERVINVPLRGIGLKTLSKIKEFAEINHLSLWKASIKMNKQEQFTQNISQSIKKFIDLINLLASFKETMKLDILILNVINHSGLMMMYENSKEENSHQKIDNLKELVNAANEFLISINNSQLLKKEILINFLSFSVLDGDRLEEKQDSIQMMTLHMSKGLEFPYVFISGLEDGLFPSYRSIEEGRLEEERRLCYVGITRAMHQLILTYSKFRHQYTDISHQKPSRFVKEIPKEYLFYINDRQDKQIKFNKKSLYKIGDMIYHPKFGIGRMINIDHDNDLYKIKFKTLVGIKTLCGTLSKIIKI